VKCYHEFVPFHVLSLAVKKDREHVTQGKISREAETWESKKETEEERMGKGVK
jgi:hypothetical protein